MRAWILVAVFTLAGCDAPARQVELGGMAMGTQFSVKLPAGIGDRDALLLQREVEGALESIEQMMSTYRIDSEISRFNASQTTDWYAVSSAFCISVEDALAISAVTDGASTITIDGTLNSTASTTFRIELPAG